MSQHSRDVIAALGCALLAACSAGGDLPTDDGAASPAPAVTLDLSCDRAAYPSPAWTACEAANYAMILQAPTEVATNPAFVLRWVEQSAANLASYLARAAADPSWLLASSPLLTALLGTAPADQSQTLQSRVAAIRADPASALAVSLDTPLTPLCATWGLQCSGDPFRYPGMDRFYAEEAQVTPVVFYDSGCARLSGRIWRPQYLAPGAQLPAVIIQNGSIQAPEPVYWWAAQLLVRNGYVVMSFDPRGQGRSDWQTPDGVQGGNINVSVFWTGLVDAIDFLRSTPGQVYPNNLACAGTYPTLTTPYNPEYAVIDRERLGLAGHSAGAEGVSVVQGYGGAGAEPWPGQIDSANPVKVVVAWDGLVTPDGQGFGGATGNLPGLPDTLGTLPKTSIRVPAMDQASEYGLAPIPFLSPPEPDAHKAAFAQWQAAGVPVFALTIRGSTHYEWSQLPTFPATSWCPQIVDGACTGGWGVGIAAHHTLAWFDRWLKQPGEPGYADADARLLDDNGVQGRNKMSWHLRSARSFPTRDGAMEECEDIRAGCVD